jgi:hypothetical protein
MSRRGLTISFTCTASFSEAPPQEPGRQSPALVFSAKRGRTRHDFNDLGRQRCNQEGPISKRLTSQSLCPGK